MRTFIKKTNFYYKSIFFLVFIFLFIIAAFRNAGVDRDYSNYESTMKLFLDNHYYNFNQLEPSFYLISNIAQFLPGDVVKNFFAIYAFLALSITLYAIRKNSFYPLLSLILYVCLYYPLFGLTQIRAGVAAAIFLLALPDIANRHLKSFLIKTAAACFFHYSAFVMVLTYPLGKIFSSNEAREKIFYFFLPISGMILAFCNLGKILLVNVVNFLPGFMKYKINIYSSLYDQGIFNRIKIFDPQYIILLVIYFFAIANIDKFKNNLAKVEFKIIGLMFFIFYTLYFIPVIAGRLSEFLGVVSIFALPSLILIIRQKVFAYLVIFFSSFAFIYYIIFIEHLIVF